jgi:hypothetical protein
LQTKATKVVCLKRTHSIDNTFYRKHILSAAVGDIADQSHERSVRARASEKKRKGVEKKSARVPVKKKKRGRKKERARASARGSRELSGPTAF